MVGGDLFVVSAYGSTSSGRMSEQGRIGPEQVAHSLAVHALGRFDSREGMDGQDRDW